jgi:transmembrane sensor
MKSYEDYVLFQTEDFLEDEHFKRWIKQPTPESKAYFQGLLRTHPSLRQAFEEARHIALGLEVSQVQFSETYTHQLFEKIVPQLSPSDEPIRIFPWRRLAVAASVMFVLGTVFWTYYYYFEAKNYQTAFAQIQTLELYDGSVVTLNANSHLTLPSRYEWSKKRTVSLDGEAYFMVSKVLESDTKYKKFTVQTVSGQVEVYGTQFNVYARNDQMKVLLDEGKVKIIDAKSDAVIDLLPKQFVELNRAGKIAKVIEHPAQQLNEITSWKRNLLVFNDADMKELAQRFQEVYGLSLVLKGEAFENQQFQGELPVNDIEEALLILSTTFGQKTLRDNNKIYFVPNE